MTLALVLGVAACAQTVTVTFPHCGVDAVLSADSGRVGDTITLTGRPMTDAPDTEVRLGGERALVLSVDRNDCTLCDECIVAAECSPCGTCDACAIACESCVQTVTFNVPEVSDGERPVVLINAYGSTAPLGFEVVPLADLDTDTPGDTDDSDLAADSDT